LKVTLTGHISPVRGLQLSDRHPYLFSGGEDKQVKCWDLEQNKVVRHYHGHLQGVYSLALHPTLDLLVTAGRDAVARVWDIRSRQPVFILTGHSSTIYSVAAQAAHPQVVTASMDTTVRLWDLAAGKTLATLTHHKKSVRGLALHPREFAFSCGGSRDSLKKFLFPNGVFLHDFRPLRSRSLSQEPTTFRTAANTIVNCIATNEDNVMVTGSDDGYLEFYDWRSGQAFQRLESPPQLGSLDSEAGIFACHFDRTGLRLITAEADKTIKVWRELSQDDPDAG
jgi:pleiotropic regulator 1